jgi:hypothetical protein
VLTGIERANRSDAPLAIAGGLLFLAWAGFVYQTGWTSAEVARRLRRGDHVPRRGGFIFWSSCIVSAVFGLIALVSGLALLF